MNILYKLDRFLMINEEKERIKDFTSLNLTFQSFTNTITRAWEYLENPSYAARVAKTFEDMYVAVVAVTDSFPTISNMLLNRETDIDVKFTIDTKENKVTFTFSLDGVEASTIETFRYRLEEVIKVKSQIRVTDFVIIDGSTLKVVFYYNKDFGTIWRDYLKIYN